MAYEEFKHLITNNSMLSSKIGEKSHIELGIIETVNLESQMMSVSLPFKNNITVEDICINSPLSSNGAGIRFMPTNGMFVLLHFDIKADSTYYHIGYFNGNLESFTNNSLGTKTDNRATMRYLDSGEVMLSNGDGGELYLSNKNTILLKNGDGFFLTVEEDVFKGLFNDLNFTLNDILMDVGRIKRVTRAYGTKPEDIKDVNPTIIRTEPEDEEEDKLPLNEFSVSLGTFSNSLGIPDVLKNTTFDFNVTPTGTIKLADAVYDEIGTQVTSLKTLTEAKNILQFLLKMGTGIKIGIDTEGSLFIVNEYTDSHIKFKVGATKSDDNKTENNIMDLSELEIMIAKSVFKINKDGELTFTNQNVGTENDDDKKKISITSTKDSVIIVKTETDEKKYNTITINEDGLIIETTKEDGKINTVTLNSDTGINIKDLNDNEISMTDEGFTIKDKNNNEIVSSSSGIKINGNLEILL